MCPPGTTKWFTTAPLESSTVDIGLLVIAGVAPEAAVMSCHVSEKPRLVLRAITCPLVLRKYTKLPVEVVTAFSGLVAAASGVAPPLAEFAPASSLGRSQAHDVRLVHQLSTTPPLLRK